MKYGAQLYTVREFMQTKEDFAQTAEKISRLGYDCVQVSGASPDISAAEIAEICKARGLEIAITHASPARILQATDEVIREHRLMGARYIGIGMIPGGYERDLSGFRRFFADFKPAARAIKEAGMQLMYHNHHVEFEKFDGKTAMDYFFEEFPDIGFTLDTYWVQAGGADTAHWIKKLGARAEVLHLKDFAVVGGQARMCEVMEGNMNWPAIMEAAKAAGVKYAMVEQDDCYGQDPFECLGISLNNLGRFM